MSQYSLPAGDYCSLSANGEWQERQRNLVAVAALVEDRRYMSNSGWLNVISLAFVTRCCPTVKSHNHTVRQQIQALESIRNKLHVPLRTGLILLYERQ